MNARTRFFHFQTMHRTVMTNKKLYQFNMRDNALCDVCQEQETISHLLYECPNIRILWQELQEWLGINLTSTLHFDKTSVLLGNQNNEHITNTLIIITKHEIFKKCKARPLHLRQLKLIFKAIMQTELYLGTVKNQRAKALGKWSSIYNELRLL